MVLRAPSAKLDRDVELVRDDPRLDDGGRIHPEGSG
jgi:hypothetical protein